MNIVEHRRLYYLAHKDKINKQSKTFRHNNPNYYNLYYLAHKDKAIKYAKKYRKNNIEKIIAHNFINDLLRDSDFTRDICSICSKPDAEFHHENYDLPNFGYWFCKEHHKLIHRKEK